MLRFVVYESYLPSTKHFRFLFGALFPRKVWIDIMYCIYPPSSIVSDVVISKNTRNWLLGCFVSLILTFVWTYPCHPLCNCTYLYTVQLCCTLSNQCYLRSVNNLPKRSFRIVRNEVVTVSSVTCFATEYVAICSNRKICGFVEQTSKPYQTCKT